MVREQTEVSMEDILKELGTWAALRKSRRHTAKVPGGFTAAEATARAGRFVYESDAISSWAESRLTVVSQEKV